MALKNTLTNELLNQRFDNPFALVNYAIGLAKTRVMRGEGMNTNPENGVLQMIAKGEDCLEDDEDDEDEDDEEETL